MQLVVQGAGLTLYVDGRAIQSRDEIANLPSTFREISYRVWDASLLTLKILEDGCQRHGSAMLGSRLGAL